MPDDLASIRPHADPYGDFLAQALKECRRCDCRIPSILGRVFGKEGAEVSGATPVEIVDECHGGHAIDRCEGCGKIEKLLGQDGEGELATGPCEELRGALVAFCERHGFFSFRSIKEAS